VAKLFVYVIQPLTAEGGMSNDPRPLGVRKDYWPRSYAFIRTHEGYETLTGNYLFGDLDAIMMA